MIDAKMPDNLPQWMKDHQHLHGLAWSLCGAVSGASLVWAGRVAANRILGFPAIGFGDVTLMAMIGAIVLARRDVFASDIVTGEPADQGLIEKSRTPLLLEKSN